MGELDLEMVDRSREVVYDKGMKTIAAEDFRDQCLSILDQVEPDGVLITKGGKPIARLLPIQENCADLIGALKGKIKIKGDIMSTGLSWNAES